MIIDDDVDDGYDNDNEQVDGEADDDVDVYERKLDRDDDDDKGRLNHCLK